MKKLLLLLLLLLVACNPEELPQTTLEENQEAATSTITEPEEKTVNLYIEEGSTFHAELNELPLGTTLNIVNQDKRVHHFTLTLVQENEERIIENFKSKRLEPGNSFKFTLDKKGELRIIDIWNADLRTKIKVT